MRIFVLSFFIAVLGLGACSSRVNPVNWGKQNKQDYAQTAPQEVNPLIPKNPQRSLWSRITGAEEDIYQGKPIDQVTSVKLEPIPGGAILRASGISIFQGFYDVQLTPENDDILPEGGVLSFRLEGLIPYEGMRGGPENLRTVTAGFRLTQKEITRAKIIRVEGITNAQSVGRR